MKLKSHAEVVAWLKAQRLAGSALSCYEDQVGRLGYRMYKCAEPGCKPEKIMKSGKYKPLCGYYVRIGKMDRNWISRMLDDFLHIWIKGKPHTNEPPEVPASAQVCALPYDLLTY